MYTFYRIANLFTDVPHLRNTTKKRHWLVSLLTNRIPLEKQRTYEYLYRITFIRSGDYLGMYIRLIIIGGLAIYFVPNMWLKVIFGLLFLYMSIFQMTTLYRHHRMLIWIDLYPVSLAERQKALLQFMTQLSMIQTIIFALIFLMQFNYQGAVILLGGGIVFTYLFINGYVRKKVTIAS
ncbi:ABC transporter permease [Paracerasibacillus soli]|uniref:ABC transporter permease n=2 Tax=Paracerasibacillus soli TaxID=480284 RepID=A0ABU5CN85_9BACI|nr:ABC transporter permease [Virgibacillus soli]MDY0407822.1 ABC transporter permease [Virgibacillus soli]